MRGDGGTRLVEEVVSGVLDVGTIISEGGGGIWGERSE